MARRGFLDYVLGGAVGGLEGLAQRRAAEAEQKRLDEATSRQRMLDTISLINSGYNPEGFSQDMPGATPRPAFDTQTVGGRKFTRTMSPSQQQHMEDVQKEQAMSRSKKLDASLRPPKEEARLPFRYTEGERGQNIFNPNDGTSTYQPYAEGFSLRKPVGRSGGTGGLSAKTMDAMRTAEAWFNAPNNDPAQVKLARDVFVALRESRPDAAPQELMLDAYNAVKEQMKMANTAAQISQRQRSNQPKAGGRTLGAPPGMAKPAAEDDVLGAAFDNYKKGGK
jgi:hypothetical protein